MQPGDACDRQHCLRLKLLGGCLLLSGQNCTFSRAARKYARKRGGPACPVHVRSTRRAFPDLSFPPQPGRPVRLYNAAN